MELLLSDVWQCATDRQIQLSVTDRSTNAGCESSIWEILKSFLDMVLGNYWLLVALPEEEVGPGKLQRSLPAPTDL